MSDRPTDGFARPAEDDLDIAFGPDTASVPVRTTRQRVRRSALVGLGVVLTVGVIAVVLITIVGSVQNGVGGVFPRPQAALDRFDAAAQEVDGVDRVTGGKPDKTSFASYDVSSTIAVSPTLSDGERVRVVDALSAAADEASGNGVRVFAIADLGSLEVGVSADRAITEKRLRLAGTLDAIGGVTGVRCDWGDGDRSDEPADLVVTVETPGTGDVLVAIVDKAKQATRAEFPGATVRSGRPTP
ncbi:hypothetical protein ACRQ4B_11750 [Curtobacterium sp. SP.BCo]|uniref:hypothetical protein n=1 Tax=Curtobacterium sp. SP.BCo TaxID=3435229 RepID=UPI003F7368E6